MSRSNNRLQHPPRFARAGSSLRSLPGYACTALLAQGLRLCERIRSL